MTRLDAFRAFLNTAVGEIIWSGDETYLHCEGRLSGPVPEGASVALLVEDLRPYFLTRMRHAAFVRAEPCCRERTDFQTGQSFLRCRARWTEQVDGVVPDGGPKRSARAFERVLSVRGLTDASTAEASSQ